MCITIDIGTDVLRRVNVGTDVLRRVNVGRMLNVAKAVVTANLLSLQVVQSSGECTVVTLASVSWKEMERITQACRLRSL